MNIRRRPEWTAIGVIILACLLATDIAVRLRPTVSAADWLPIDSAHAQQPVADGQDQPSQRSRPPIYFPPFPIEEGRGRFFHIALNVRDLDTSVEFYRDQLRFKVIRYQEFGDIASSAFITTGDGEPIIELMQMKREVEGVPSIGFSHLGIFVEDVDRYYDESIKAGATWQGPPAAPGRGAPVMGFMIDPDGNRVEVMANPKGGCTSCHRGPHLN